MGSLHIVDHRDPREVLVEELQEIVEDIKQGRKPADTAVIILRDPRSETMYSPMVCGQAVSNTHMLGIMEFAKMHCFHNIMTEASE